jgi:hypothetical protein
MRSGAVITAEDLISEVLARNPRLEAVFESRGLLECGGANGPREAIGFFARAHRVDTVALLAELNDAMNGRPVPAPPRPSLRSTPTPPPLYRRFVRAAIICTMTLGATFGAFNLLWIHWALGPVPPAHNSVHATFQVTGFVLLFLMGVAYQVVPRFLGTRLALRRLAEATFFLGLGGLLLRAYGQLGSLVPATAPVLLAGAIVQLLGVVGFALVLAVTWVSVRPRLEPFHLGLAAGLVGWIAAAALLVAGGVAAWRAADAEASIPWNEPFYLAALFGGTLAFVEGITLRTASVFLGVRPAHGRLAVLAIVLGQLGTALTVVGKIWCQGRPAMLAVMNVGLLASAVGFTLFVAAARVLTRRVQPADDDPVPAFGARAAFVAGLLFAALAGLYGGMSLTGHIPPSALYDGARHALGLGFITMLIFSMGRRMLPVFDGAALRWTSASTAGLVLICVGLVMRELQVVVFLFHWPELLRVSGMSGLVAATGVCLCGGGLLATLSRRRRAERDTGAGCEPANGANAGLPFLLGPESTIAAILRAFPAALPVLLAEGFTPLANPVARQTIARVTTLRSACALTGRDLDAVLARLRAACPESPASRRSLPIIRA